MNIIFNHTFRSIKDNMKQLFVIVFTVTIVSTLFFVSLTLRDIFFNIQYSMATRISGKSEVKIESTYFSKSELESFLEDFDEVENVDTFLQMTGLVKIAGQNAEKAVQIEETDLQNFVNTHTDTLIYVDGIKQNEKYIYPEIWVSNDFAEENNLSIGSEIELFVPFYGTYFRYNVCYIFEKQGIFANSNMNTVLIDYESCGDRGLINCAYIDIKDDTDIDKFISSLKQKIDNDVFIVTETVDYDYINNLVQDNENLVTVAFIFVIALIVFILITSFNIIFQKRGREMVVFRSTGATFFQMLFLLLSEGLFYGVFGSVIGIIIGRFALQLVSILVIPTFHNAIQCKFYYYFVAILFGCVLSLISSFFPALRLVKKTISELKADKKEKPKYFFLFTIPFIIVLIACILLMREYNDLIILFSLFIIISVAGLIYIITPYLLKFISVVYAKTNGLLKLSSCTISKNSNSVKIITMISAVIVFSFVSVNIVNIIIDAVRPYNGHFQSDFVIQSISEQNDITDINSIVSNTFGVEKSYVYNYEKFKMTADKKEIEYTVVNAPSSASLELVTDANMDRTTKEKFDNTDNAIVISYDMANRLNKKVGDPFVLNLNNKCITFEIIAIDSTKTQNDRICFIHSNAQCSFKNSIILANYDKNCNSQDIFNELSSILQEKKCFIMYYDDWNTSTTVGMDGIALLLQLLQILISLVALIGVLNMSFSEQLERKKEFNVYLSAGMDLSAKNLLLFFESIHTALIGGILGFCLSLAFTPLLPEFGKIIDRYIDFNLIPTSLPLTTLTVMALYIILNTFLSFLTNKKTAIERNPL